MKKYIVITVLVLMGLIAACAPTAAVPAEVEEEVAEEVVVEEVEETTSDDSALPVAPSKKVAWIASNIANEFTTGMAANAESIGADNGWEVTVFNPDSDLSKQISQIENASSQEFAALIIDPVAFDGMTAVLEDVTSNYDIPVITLHGSCSAQDLLTAFVAIDIQQGGVLKMEQVAKDLDGKGDIAIMTGTEGQTTAIFITDGYNEVLPNYPDINVVFQGAGNWNADDATPLAENWLSSGKNLDAIVCNNDGMALGVRAVLQAAGLTGEIKLYGLDATPEGRKAVRDGSMDASIWVDSYAEFEAAFEIINAFYAGEPFEKEIMISPVLVTKDNIDELFPDD